MIFLPNNLDELWPLLAAYPDACLMAGGTDVLVARRGGRIAAGTLIGLELIAELRGVREHADYLEIGAATPLADLLADARIGAAFPALTRALSHFGGAVLRQMATLGGNICNASPAGDSLPPLYALGACLRLASAGGERLLPIAEFVTGARRTALLPGEILASIRLPLSPSWNFQHFEKLGTRQAMAIAVVSLAICAELDADRRVAQIRCAWGAVAPTVVMSEAVDAALRGHRLTQERLTAVAPQVMAAIAPISDLRASADYRRRMASGLLLRIAQSARF